MTVATVLSTSLFGMIISPLTPIILGFIAQQVRPTLDYTPPKILGSTEYIRGHPPVIRRSGHRDFLPTRWKRHKLGHREPRIYARRILHP